MREHDTYPYKDTCCVNISSKLCHFDQVRRWDYQSSFVVEFLYRFRDFLIPTENYIRYPAYMLGHSHTNRFHSVKSLFICESRADLMNLGVLGENFK